MGANANGRIHLTARWWSRVTAFITLAAAWRLLAPTVADPDLWGHILFGQRTLSMGIEREDPFSYLSAGHGWINHEWMAEVVFGALYDAGGALALVALKMLLALLTVGLIYWHLVRRGSDPLRAGLLVLATLFLMAPGFATVRPQMFTLLFFTLALIFLHQAETRSERWLWALPPLLAVWINFHGGVLAAVGLLGIWGATRVIDAVASPDRRTAIRALRVPASVGIACAIGLLANPYGPALPAFLMRTATLPRPDITEWQSLRILSAPGFIYMGVTAFALVTLARSDVRRRPALLAALVAVVLLPLTAVRHLQLFAIGLPILLADDFAAAWRRKTVTAAAGPWKRAMVIGVTVAVGTLLVATGARDAACIRIDPERSIAFPARAVEWLDSTGAQGNMVTFFDWGEYVIWHLAPDIRVSMDGRRETVYPDSIRHEYLRFQSGLEGWRDLLERPETDFVLFSRAWPAYQLVSLDPEWERVYEDPIAGVFVRTGDPMAAVMRATAPSDLPASGAGQCVP